MLGPFRLLRDGIALLGSLRTYHSWKLSSRTHRLLDLLDKEQFRLCAAVCLTVLFVCLCWIGGVD